MNNNVNNKTYIPLTPFKGWVLENFPFIEADFDCITNYQLMCKVTEYLNNVISNQNQVQELGTELVNAYNSLLDYVNNYFNNLDVQEEINNKLDALVEDGTLTTLIGNYVDPYIEEQNNRITNINTNLNNRIDEQTASFNSQLNVINNKVNSATSGNPLIASSTSEMSDTTRVYVNTSDGNWYYYNGTTWVVGGVYQSTQIPDYSITNEKIKTKDLTIENNTFYKDLLPLATDVLLNKKITGYNGTSYEPTYANDSTFDCYVFNTSDLIALGDYINKFSFDNTKTYQAYVLYTSGTKALNVEVQYINNTNNSVKWERLTTYDNVAICFPKENKRFITQYKYFNSNDILNDLSTNLEIKNQSIKKPIYGSNIDLNKTDLIQQNGVTILKNRVLTGYSTTSNNLITSKKNNYTTIIIDTTTFTEFKNLTSIKFKVSTNMDSSTQTICGSNTNNEGFNFPKSYLMTGNISNFYDSTTGIYDWGGFLKTNMYYMDNFNKFGITFYSDDIELYSEEITKLNTNRNVIAPLLCSVNAFNSIGAIGDSYTAASTKHNGVNYWTDQTEQSYIATMAKRAGIDYDNYGVGGATTRSYLTNANGMQKVLNTNANDFYFLALGINDGSLGTQYIGSIDDIKSDYTQNADTFYGNYGKIIAQLKLHAPKAKLCMILIPLKSGTYFMFDEAIKNIASHFGIPYIDPFDDYFFNSDLYRTKVEGHPTCIGYVGMGLAYERLLSKCISENINYFLYSTVG